MREKYYTKKPIPVAALYWDGTDDDMMVDSIDYFIQTVPRNDNDYAQMFTVTNENDVSLLVLDTLEGPMSSYKPCYIIRGVRGEFYICEESIFNETYEEVNA
jgi:hypothetical protein